MLATLVGLTAIACSTEDSEGPAGADGEPGTYSGYVVDPPVDVSAIVLPDTGGAEFEMTARPGGIQLVYFGYTFCPDVCPTTMSDIRSALEDMPPSEADRVGLAMVTIDPDRDTDQVIERYVTNFVEDGVALRSDDPELLRTAADAFGADYSVEPAEGDTVDVSHTGELYAVDDTGTLVMQWPFGTSAESLSRDLRSLLATADRT